MDSDRPSWLLDERVRGTAYLVAAIAVFVGTYLTREDPVLTLSILAPAVAAFALWIYLPDFPEAIVLILGTLLPVVLHVIETYEEVSMFLIVLTVMALSIETEKRVLVRAWTAVVLALIWLFDTLDVITDFGVQNWFFGIIFSWAVGEVIGQLLRTLVELRETRAVIADQAAVNERRRIARDVHDLVGHSLSVVMLHITGARHVLRKDPDEAERALEQAEQAGRESLREIRRTVGLLRDEADGGAMMPSQDLSDVQTLADEFALAGLDVKVSSVGALDDVDPAISLAGFRIVQEALTNVSRHTTGARATVHLTVLGDRCEVAVRNHGGETVDLGRGAGYGLISMRERARAVGGSLVAGPTRDGWSVEASLPIAAAGPVR